MKIAKGFGSGQEKEMGRRWPRVELFVVVGVRARFPLYGGNECSA
jgi:hypothetical protein